MSANFWKFLADVYYGNCARKTGYTIDPSKVVRGVSVKLHLLA